MTIMGIDSLCWKELLWRDAPLLCSLELILLLRTDNPVRKPPQHPGK